MHRFAVNDGAWRVDWPRIVELPADATALEETCQSPSGGGRHYTIAVGSQIVMLVCFNAPDSGAQVLGQCDRIARRLSPTTRHSLSG